MKNPRKAPPTALTIAGSDSGGGAGIQADLKTFAALGVHGVSAITAITAQNTRAVTAASPLKSDLILAQLDVIFDDFQIGAIKIGMLANSRVIRLVADRLKQHLMARPCCPIVLDPVMIASSGAQLLASDAVIALKKYLLPLATLITPNLPEAEVLLGRKIRRAQDMSQAAADLMTLNCKAVLLKGGHLPKGQMLDVLFDGTDFHTFENNRLLISGHGTGCTLSSAIAAKLASGEKLLEATRFGVEYVHSALKNAYRPGRGTVSVLGRGQ